jgi:hypothetical protein
MGGRFTAPLSNAPSLLSFGQAFTLPAGPEHLAGTTPEIRAQAPVLGRAGPVP